MVFFLVVSEGKLVVFELHQNDFLPQDGVKVVTQKSTDPVQERKKIRTFDLQAIGTRDCESRNTFFSDTACSAFYRNSKLAATLPEKEKFLWKKSDGHFTLLKEGTKETARGYYREDGKEYGVEFDDNAAKTVLLEQEEGTYGGVPRGRPGVVQKRKETKMLFQRDTKGMQKTIEVGLVADYSYVSSFKTLGEAEVCLINSFSVANGIIEKQVGVSLSVEKMNMEAEPPKTARKESADGWRLQCSQTVSLDDRLNSFILWRGQQTDSYGLYHLVSFCRDGNCVGLACPSSVCSTEAKRIRKDEYNSGASMTSKVSTHHYNIAHEIAHNLGASHDCTSKECFRDSRDCCECDGCDCGGRYIMDPIGKKGEEFSPCSVREMKRHLAGVTCLKEKAPKKGSLCGNGIKEEGEECDCGDEESCKNDPCCLPGCRLKEGAQCSDKNDGCCSGCQVIAKEETHRCRKADGVCQYDCYCDGASPECPIKDAPDGGKCEYTEEDGSLCVDGVCTGRNRECIVAGEKYGVSGSCESKLYPTCDMWCEVPREGCVKIGVSHRNGTKCYLNGVCQNGECEHTVGGIVKTKEFLGAVGLVLFSVLIFIFLKIRKRRRRV
ncbi:MAG: zinc metalloprotease [Amphiamblys sp. WSBS2006]|nr:MAG: zinc metalloprotease [Amphiamblys sp. WSBS2006]